MDKLLTVAEVAKLKGATLRGENAWRSEVLALCSTIERMLLDAEAAREHLEELAEAWRTGAIHEIDGRGGMRSNRNWDVMSQFQKTCREMEADRG